MSPFLFYIARAGLYLSLFYAFYLLVMRRTTFFRLNRVLLLLGSYLCLALPLIRLRTVQVAAVASDLTMIAAREESVASAPAAFPWGKVLLEVYAAGALVTLGLYLLSSWKMGRLIRKGSAQEREGCRLVLLDQDMPSFSWGRTVVMSRKDLAENPAIFAHEKKHVACRHSLDLLLFLPLQLLFWWNPLVWITREELRLLHEYQADEGVIQDGIDATQYQLLLVRKAVGEQRFTLASGFQHANLKNRISMMLKSTSSGWMRWSYLALIPVLALVMFACNPSKKSKQAEAVPFSDVAVKPAFNGGDLNAFSQWVNAHLTYPENAKESEIQGRVVVQFTVGADGVVRDATVVRSVDKMLDDEVLRVVAASPKWEPGHDEKGKDVPVLITFPVVFQLR